ncbi:MAG: tRNA pseudouridine(13) synthase TruD [Phycisphaerales bacterium]|nr:tRNA pseudouridine(13) synthase TruD [Phycisphaerales bacterium]
MTAPPPSPVDQDPHVLPSAYVTAAIPGIGGSLKQRPEDFLVEEMSQYEPCGEGEHLYLFIEKRDLSTQQLVSIVAEHFGVDRRAVGYAGMTDKLAITRQVISIHTPGRSIDDFAMLRHDRISVLWADRHTNKLRVGHLRGNRFSIRIRGVEPSSVLRASRVLDILERTGLPNRIGEQRFGLLQNNHLIGRAMIMGDFDTAVSLLLAPSPQRPELNAEARASFLAGDFARARDAFHHSARAERAVLLALSRGASPVKAFLRLDPVLKGFFLSAFQSAVFNAVLDGRVADASFGTLRPGDLAVKHINGAVFNVDDAVLTDPGTTERLASFEISPSGPVWGVSMRRAGGEVGEAELAALARAGVTPDDLERFDRTNRDLINGTRRALRAPVMHPQVEGGVDEHGAYVRCAFDLPKGSFATVVMGEVMKCAAAPDEGAEPEAE